eukprot:981587-Prorocentrum_minimum.AAC.4
MASESECPWPEAGCLRIRWARWGSRVPPGWSSRAAAAAVVAAAVEGAGGDTERLRRWRVSYEGADP